MRGKFRVMVYDPPRSNDPFCEIDDQPLAGFSHEASATVVYADRSGRVAVQDVRLFFARPPIITEFRMVLDDLLRRRWGIAETSIRRITVSGVLGVPDQLAVFDSRDVSSVVALKRVWGS
jgi:hypothetical protein